MEDIYKKSKKAARYIQEKFGSGYDFALVAGSGLGALYKDFKIRERIEFDDIPHVKAGVFHRGEFLLCKSGKHKFIVLTGRLHFYEGYTAEQVGFPIRVLAALGIKRIIMTNAAGGLNPALEKGDIAMVVDHINLIPDNPLRGTNDDRLGPRFPDMAQAYSKKMRDMAIKAAKGAGIPLREGVYAAFPGPNLETPAEYRFLHIIGGDMVGMSTVPEVIAARHSGIEVLVFSIITNMCYPPEKVVPVTVEEVLKTAHASAGKLGIIIQGIIDQF